MDYMVFILALALVSMCPTQMASPPSDYSDSRDASMGVIFSATSPNFLNNCTIAALCDRNVPVIVFLPASSIDVKIDASRNCPQIVYMIQDEIQLIPIVTSKTTRKDFMVDYDMVRARSFKIRSIRRCPFPQTLYLDNDVNIVDYARVFDWFAHMRRKGKLLSMKNDRTVHPGHFYKYISNKVYERNAGIMYLMCNDSAVVSMLGDWEYAYFHHATPDFHDQGPWRYVLNVYQSLRAVLDLPENYNCRYDLYQTNRSACYINHVQPTHYNKTLPQDIVGARNCTL